MRFVSLVLSALFALSLTACDSSDTGLEPGVLVGTWSLSALEREVYATSSVAQSYTDYEGTSTGQVSVTGSATASLSYADFVQNDASYRQARLTSYDPSQPTDGSQTVYSLELYGSPTNGTIRLNVSGPSGYDTYEGYVSTAPFTLVDGRLRVPTVTLTSYYNTSRQVQIGGELSFPTVSFVPGQRTLIERQSTPFTGGTYESGFRYVFEDGGVYRAEQDMAPNVTQSVAGTWAADGDRLRLSVTRDEVTETRTFTYAVAGESLRLSYLAYDCEGDPGCLRNFEAGLGLVAGSLTAYEARETSVFTRGTSEARAASPPSASAQASLWPRMLAQPAAQ